MFILKNKANITDNKSISNKNNLSQKIKHKKFMEKKHCI